MRPEKSLAMRNVIVTGGSRGLGLGIVRKLAENGYRVLAIARQSNDEFKLVLREAEKTHPGSLHFSPFDLGNIQDLAGLAKKLRKNFGPIYGLVNNAAIGSHGVLATMYNSEIERLIRINTLSPIVFTKYIVRYMLADGGGRVVNVASIIGFTGYSGLSVYGATKASLIGFTRSLAREVGRMGVNVNAVAPGYIETDMTEDLGDEQRHQIIRRSALRRLPRPEDVANAVEFLLGDKAGNITGTVLTVDAGSTA
jgi:3-oxoacyl-[acyl-carrier protein] reductase